MLKRVRGVQMQDDVFGTSVLRPDGRVLHEAYLFEVKTPEDSTGPWDYYKALGEAPAARADERGRMRLAGRGLAPDTRRPPRLGKATLPTSGERRVRASRRGAAPTRRPERQTPCYHAAKRRLA